MKVSAAELVLLSKARLPLGHCAFSVHLRFPQAKVVLLLRFCFVHFLLSTLKAEWLALLKSCQQNFTPTIGQGASAHQGLVSAVHQSSWNYLHSEYITNWKIRTKFGIPFAQISSFVYLHASNALRIINRNDKYDRTDKWVQNKATSVP